MAKTVRVGVMPGRINEFAVEVGTSVADVIALAELNTDGYEVKVDGEKVDASTAVITEGTNLVLLTKMVKGNSIVRIGKMPGRINEFTLGADVSIAEALQIAELDASGYDVKVDGEKVDNLNQPIGSASLILLAKQVKGN